MYVLPHGPSTDILTLRPGVNKISTSTARREEEQKREKSKRERNKVVRCLALWRTRDSGFEMAGGSAKPRIVQRTPQALS